MLYCSSVHPPVFRIISKQCRCRCLEHVDVKMVVIFKIRARFIDIKPLMCKANTLSCCYKIRLVQLGFTRVLVITHQYLAPFRTDQCVPYCYSILSLKIFYFPFSFQIKCWNVKHGYSSESYLGRGSGDWSCLCPRNNLVCHSSSCYHNPSEVTIYEPPHDKTNKMACVPSERHRSAWASMYRLDAITYYHASMIVKIFKTQTPKKIAVIILK